jgi:predicted transposase YbfD/YdcC
MTVRTYSGKTSVTIRYFISSVAMNAAHFLKHVRDHWQIENGLHWVLDIAFREDASRVHIDHAPQNLATLRHMATNLLKHEQSVSVGMKAKRKMAGWDNDYLLKVLGGA